MSKKEKAAVVNNIKELNLEIDYDKLAEAIVKAQEKAKDEKTKSGTNGKPRFFSVIWSIIKGKKSDDGRFLSAPFVGIISGIYRCIAIVGLIALIAFDISAVISLINNATWQGWNIVGNIVIIVVAIFLSITVFLYLVIFWGAANDVEHEKDKNYVMSIFSGLVSVAALIVAIIALSKGVG